MAEALTIAAEETTEGPHGAGTHVFYAHPYNIPQVRLAGAILGEWADKMPPLARLIADSRISLTPLAMDMPIGVSIDLRRGFSSERAGRVINRLLMDLGGSLRSLGMGHQAQAGPALADPTSFFGEAESSPLVGRAEFLQTVRQANSGSELRPGDEISLVEAVSGPGEGAIGISSLGTLEKIIDDEWASVCLHGEDQSRLIRRRSIAPGERSQHERWKTLNTAYSLGIAMLDEEMLGALPLDYHPLPVVQGSARQLALAAADVLRNLDPSRGSRHFHLLSPRSQERLLALLNFRPQWTGDPGGLPPAANPHLRNVGDAW